MKQISIFIILILLLFSCSTDNTDSNENEKETSLEVAGELPLLQKPKGVGIIRGFNPTNPPMTTDSMETRWQEAITSGMHVGRLQIDWPELEPQQGVFDTAVLQRALDEATSDGLQSFLLISVYDSDGPVLPSDLEGLPLNDERIIGRFQNLMDWVIPMLVENDGYAISISNEADVNFENFPNLNTELLDFIKEMKSYIHAIDSEMAVTVTIAAGSLDRFSKEAEEIISFCDVACFNFYGAKSTFSPPYNRNLNENEVREEIRHMLEIAGTKNVLIQELGMHSDSTFLGSSEELQRKFFEVFFTAMQEEERIKAAYVFQLVDWSEEASEVFRSLFPDDEASQAFFDSYSLSLQSLGLITYEDGTQRPAWDEFLKAIGAFR